MQSDYLKNLTPEQRMEMREKAAASKEAKRKYAEENLKLSYDDV